MPTYEHICTECNYEWEADYSIKIDPPKICPQCNKETAKRLISGGHDRKGVVELTGHELKAKLQEDGRKMAKEMRGSESKMANFHGESKIQQLTVAKERAIDNLTRIKYSSKK